MKRWEEIFTGEDRKLMEAIGFGRKQTFGTKPALLIIDVTRSFIGSKPLPVLESIKEYSSSCGEVGWKALPPIKRLLESCRARGIPVIFTTADPVGRLFIPGPTKRSVKPSATLDSRAEEIPEAITPLPSELVIRKIKGSAFFGTPLLLYLQHLQVDTLVVTGTTTSGCVRASVVDACSYGFRCFVVEEGTFDRLELSHLVNLFDMNAKYADVITLEEALQEIAKHQS